METGSAHTPPQIGEYFFSGAHPQTPVVVGCVGCHPALRAPPGRPAVRLAARQAPLSAPSPGRPAAHSCARRAAPLRGLAIARAASLVRRWWSWEKEEGKEVYNKTDFEAIKRDYKYLTAAERRILETGIQQGATPGKLLAALIRERERVGRKAALNAASDHDRRILVGARVPRTLADAVKQAAERDGKTTYRFLVDLLEQMCYNKPYRTGDGQP